MTQQEDQPQDLREVIKKMQDPEFWGGVENHWRESITDQHGWAKLELAHDAYLPSGIAEIIEKFNPEFTKRSLLHPDDPDLEEYFAKIGETFVLVSPDEVFIVGENEQIDKIGAAVILESRVGASSLGFTPNTKGPFSWRTIKFEHDTVIPGFMIPDFQKLKEEFVVESSKQLEPESYFYRARVGGNAYLRASMDRLDVVGNAQSVERISDILVNRHADQVFRINEHCSVEYIAFNPNKKS